MPAVLFIPSSSPSPAPTALLAPTALSVPTVLSVPSSSPSTAPSAASAHPTTYQLFEEGGNAIKKMLGGGFGTGGTIADGGTFSLRRTMRKLVEGVLRASDSSELGDAKVAKKNLSISKLIYLCRNYCIRLSQ